ncbi:MULTISPECIES: SPOR domain-containing protein [unclassified Janthinobacterium]|uniref:SPOR domain-containing protein n=1 Tax=unclassified Janthinobacterium TaxID=2610881 RepID=UPI0025B5741F|nr:MULTISPECIES: SPOR domain-containing protein [unclassified Janthinobacterium]MDN2677221.1 SPOR domain-containing protein [Janthinobacterium sp. SUN033]MDN2702209.1 SPOR domain-containing protein [Janthinobacterium sp. SUN100]
MGLFSKLFKNKQESSGEDSGFYVPGEAQSPTRKRAANTSGGGGSRRGGKEAPDPVLPEKKRARRRLVGAIALALGVAVGLPMLLDSEPKAPFNDIAIDIPSKEKAVAPAPAPVPAVPVRAASNGLDQSEEIVDAPLPPAAKPTPAPAPVLAAVQPAPVKPAYVEPKPEPKPVKVEPKPEPKHETKPEPKAEPKHESKPEPKHEVKPEAKPEPKPAKPAQSADDAARALAILEGKPQDKPQEKVQDKAHDAGSGKFVVQVAALATQDKVDELQDKLREAGIKSYTQKVSSPAGERIRVRVGPFGSREDAEKTRAKLQKLGLGGSLVPA